MLRTLSRMSARGGRRRLLTIAGAALGLTIALPGLVLADAANPRSVTVVKDGLSVTLSGTWSWPSRTMPCGPSSTSHRAVGWAADWGDGYTGNFLHSLGAAASVGYHMGSATDNKVRVSSANGGLGDCGTGSSGAATGTFQGLSHTYATAGTYEACIVLYDVHYETSRSGLVLKDTKQLVAGGTNHNTDNSAETIALTDTSNKQCTPVSITVVEPKKELTLSKTVEEASFDAVGDVLHYSLSVKNTGNLPLAGPVTVTDPKVSDLSCPAVSTVGNHDSNLDPDETVVCTATHTVDLDDLNAGSYKNTATASADGTDSNEDSVTVDAIQDHDVTLRKTADEASYDAVGDVLHYSFTVSNKGNVSLAGPVTITDPKADNLSCPAVSTVGNHDGNLDPDESVTCTGDHTVGLAALNAGEFTNTATATVDGVDSNEDSVTVPADQKPKLHLVKDAEEASYNAVGDVLHYTFTVSNTGNVSLSGPVTITDPKADDLDCPAVSTVGNQDGKLDPDEEIVCTGTHTIGLAALNNGSFTNTATASADGTDSNEDSVTVDAVQDQGVALVKSVKEGSFNAVGDVLHYTFSVTNTGNVSLDGPVTITDPKATGLDCPALSTVGNDDGNLDPGETIECTGIHTITLANLNNGSFTNTAKATVGTTDSNDDSVTVDANVNRELTLKKRAQESSYDRVGDVLHYRFTVTNTGNVSLNGPVTIADNKTADEACPAVTTVGNNDSKLDPGEAIVCTASKTIAKANLTNGSLTNTATATAGSTTSNQDSVTVPADLNINVVLDASGSIQSVANQTIADYNAFLHTWQGKAPGQPYSLTLFAAPTDGLVYEERYIERTIDNVPDLNTSTFTAKGKTPLYDSVAKAIKRLAARSPQGQVLMVIMTDGIDNASTQYTAAQVKTMITNKKAAGWIFIYTDASLG